MRHRAEDQKSNVEKLRIPVASVLGLVAMSAIALNMIGDADKDTSRKSPVISERPNVITIVVDDMNDFSCRDAADYLPKSSKWLVDHGTCFEHATSTSPVCCPARSVIMTGQMPHNNGVLRQIDAEKLMIENTIQSNLGRLGVSTYGTGKFLNGIDPGGIASGDIDVGFDEHDFWYSYDYNDFATFDKAGNRLMGQEDSHTTTRTGENVRQYIDAHADSDNPFYIYAAYYAPHTEIREKTLEGMIPKPTNAHSDAKVPRFNYRPEPDASDKLPMFNIERGNKSFYNRLHKARVRALYDVDDQVANMFGDLEHLGIADKTVVLFMSDNGYSLGEHNWHGKAVPYNASINIPMLAYAPSKFAEGSTDNRDVGLIDIAPTIFDMYDVDVDYEVDGYSLLGNHIREDGQYYEFVNERSQFVRHESNKASLKVPSWRMYRREDEAYIEYYDGNGGVLAREFYDSPDQLRNLIGGPPTGERLTDLKLRIFQKALKHAKSCAGTDESNAQNPCP